ncbi:homoserine kinase [Stigmatella aurantiaca]|uniref:Homoserine kinase n=1 Tax=Stigmatella aurantiaca (strain DW4/3-1) TaxID=378806 RepID=Q08P17_STIAD|nr:homoserine kinase [Stigmatella aurantiaca]ADO71040.1 homoserine kinase [Stigmatella aurantiaca DW4/3-1]EAU62225.1 homoserine kinase [Stigmatella aurantiaca DW4/3-1]
MAVYTVLDSGAFARIAGAFGLGEVQTVDAIPEGSINTNHRVLTSSGRFFVRHTTVRSAEVLRFEAALLAHLAESHFPGPTPVLTVQGEPFLELQGGRVTVFRWLAGEELQRSQLTPVHLERLGHELGKMHRLTQSFGGSRDNPYSAAQVQVWLKGLRSNSDAEVASVAVELEGYLARAEQERGGGLEPQGVIHADLFMDNVKWLADRVGAFFDFEMACRDAYALDVAITLNAWCFDGDYLPELCQAFFRGYQDARPLSAVEREHLFGHALFGAVRYTASRIRDFHLSPLPAEQLTRKSFRTYLARARTLVSLGPAGFLARMGL